jgi:multidrug efflux pump subunit AcrA (membrane-fusion protein)
VFVTDGTEETTKVQTRDVTLGDTYGNDISVLSGLNAGDRVVTSGTNVIKPGQQVRVIP